MEVIEHIDEHVRTVELNRGDVLFREETSREISPLWYPAVVTEAPFVPARDELEANQRMRWHPPLHDPTTSEALAASKLTERVVDRTLSYG